MSMPQSYKVFIGSSFIQFGIDDENDLVFNRQFTNPSTEELLQIVEEIESGSSSTLIRGAIDINWQKFCSIFTIIEAAGGFVKNQDGCWLFIHRNGMWDLPKGKLEAGETIAACSAREVAEECGIEQPEIINPLKTTYHTYTLKGKRILKPTHWFLMSSSDSSELIPQTEEGITEVRWISTDEAKLLSKGSFGSIKQVVSEGLSTD